MSPSLGSDLTLFDAQMSALLEHFRVVRYDPRGHGGSTTAGAPYALARLGRDALAILDALGMETAHFIGLSMGGAVGQWLLVHAPERIGRAVIANTAARLGHPDLWNERIVTVLAKGTQALAAATMERWFSPAFRKRAAKRVAAVETVFCETGGEGYAGACAALRDMDLREAIKRIERPVLVISGREDSVTSDADIAALTSSIPGARHVELDCRHVSNIEQAEDFNAAVVAFLTAPMSARAPRKPPAPRRSAGGRAAAARVPLKPASTGTSTKRAAARATPAKATRRARGAVAKTPEPTRAKPSAAKAPAKKAAVKKAGPGKSAAKKTPRKSVARRTPTTARATPRKTPNKAAAKTAPAKKGAGKKTAAKKMAARRPASTRRTSPKRPGRPGGRKR